MEHVPLRCSVQRRFIQQVGTVEPEDQRKELFGEEAGSDPAAAVTKPAQTTSDLLKED